MALKNLFARVETWLTGPLDSEVQYNMHMELAGAIGVGVFTAAVNFLPVILRRSGATSFDLAIYNLLNYIGITLSGVSLLLMRSRLMGRLPLPRFAAVFWTVSRGIFITAIAATGVPYFLVLIAIYSLTNSLASPAYNRIIQAVYPAEQRGKVMAMVRLGMAVASILATPIAGLVLDHLGYQVLFPAASLFGFISIWFFLKMRVNLPPVPPNPQQSTAQIYNPFRYSRHYLLFLAGIILFGIGSLTPFTLYPIIQVDRLNLSYTELGWLTFAQNIFWLIGYLYGGRLLDRWGAIRSLQMSILLLFLGALPYLVATSGWMLLPAFILNGLCSAGFDLSMFNGILQLNPPEKVMEASSFQAAVVGIRGLIGPFIGTTLLQTGAGYNTVLLVGAGIILSGWGVLFLVKNQPKYSR